MLNYSMRRGSSSSLAEVLYIELPTETDLVLATALNLPFLLQATT